MTAEYSEPVVDDPRERNRRTALLANQLLGTPEVEEFLGLFAPEPVWHLGRRALTGRDALANLSRMAASIFPKGVVREVQRVVAEDRCVVVQHTNRGVTNRGLDYDNDYLKLYAFDEAGAIEEVWEFTDTAYSRKALSLDAE